MKQLISKLLIVCVVALCFAFCGSIFSDGYPDDDAMVVNADATLWYLDELVTLPDNMPLRLVDGRLYLPLTETLDSLGGTLDVNEDGYLLCWGSERQEIGNGSPPLCRPLHFEQESPYLYLYDFAQLFHLRAVFDSAAKKVMLYRSLPANKTDAGSAGASAHEAYLRLEDIMAAGPAGNFSHENLERLRAISDTLFENGQQFSIAWIPLYTDPAHGIQNELTRSFNLYNADFIYTLDYLTQHGGSLVLHGLTHQYGDSVSAIGNEFGSDCPFDEPQVRDRLLRAKQIARSLGFEDGAFEFPHYVATQRQLEIAEQYFDVIYQQDTRAKTYGRIEQHIRGMKPVRYIPTPTGYIETNQSASDVFSRIQETQEGLLVSLFVHPYIDYQSIEFYTSPEGIRITQYAPDGILPRLVETIGQKGLVFSSIR